MLNLKKNEIVQLEKNYESKINFYFDNQYSLHNPVIELEHNTIEINNENEITKKKIASKKERAIKKTTSIKKKKTTKIIKKTKVSVKKNNKEINEKDNDIVNNSEVGSENTEEKTGWWS